MRNAKSEIRNQKSEIRDQRSEISRQRSEGRDQRSAKTKGLNCLRSAMRLDNLEPLTKSYEKTCFILDHGPHRHGVLYFL